LEAGIKPLPLLTLRVNYNFKEEAGLVCRKGALVFGKHRILCKISLPWRVKLGCFLKNLVLVKQKWAAEAAKRGSY
jgi:hypothetical protein